MAPLPVAVQDLRNPRERMWQRPVRLPQSLAEQLQQQAQAIGCSRSALIRSLVAQGAAEVQQALAQDAAA
jgi:predicted transcriptional regulator